MCCVMLQVKSTSSKAASTTPRQHSTHIGKQPSREHGRSASYQSRSRTIQHTTRWPEQTQPPLGACTATGTSFGGASPARASEGQPTSGHPQC